MLSRCNLPVRSQIACVVALYIPRQACCVSGIRCIKEDDSTTTTASTFSEDSDFTYTAASLPDATVPDSSDATPEDANTLRFYLVDPDLSTSTATASTATAATSTDYSTYNLYMWTDATCSGLAVADDDGQLVDGLGAEDGAGWDYTANTPTGSDEYGPYWDIKLADDALTTDGSCVSLIVRDGTSKLLGDDNTIITLADYADRTVSVRDGDGTLYDKKQDAYDAWKANYSSDMFTDAAAHLIDASTLVWNDDNLADAKFVRLYYSANGGTIKPDDDGKVTADFIKLTATE